MHARAGMRGKLPGVIKLPASITVPFGSFEQALDSKENKEVKARLEAAVNNIPESNAEPKLKECRDIVMEVWSPSFSIIGSYSCLVQHGACLPPPAHRYLGFACCVGALLQMLLG